MGYPVIKKRITHSSGIANYESLGNLVFRFSSLFLPYCGYIMTNQLKVVEETGVPGENVISIHESEIVTHKNEDFQG